jgi:hypothetical protein
MKKYIILIYFLLPVNILLADNCNDPICNNESFPYFFCENGTRITKCSSNPYNEYDGRILLYPLKVDPTCIAAYSFYDQSTYQPKAVETRIKPEVPEEDVYSNWVHHDGPPEPYFDDDGTTVLFWYYGIYGYEDGEDAPIFSDNDPTTEESGYSMGDYILHDYWTADITTVPAHWTYQYVQCPTQITIDGQVVFDPSDITTALQNAIGAWLNCCKYCPSNNSDKQCSTCNLKVEWCNKASVYETENQPASSTFGLAYHDLNTNSCNLKCQEFKILLNYCDEFTGLITDKDHNDPDNPCNYTHYFYFTRNNPENNDHLWSLEAVLMHELGHIFGFDEQYGDSEGKKHCPHNGSIMDNTDFCDPTRGLSPDDECMYKKLYCWSPPSGVDENKEILEGMTIYPNPANNNIINFQFENLPPLNMTYDIVSSLGEAVSNGNILPDENPKSINIENLPSGVYYFILKYDGKQEVKKFVIDK